MKRFYKLTIVAVSLFTAWNAAATQSADVLQPQIEYQQLVNQRQVVDDLLAQAVEIQKSPARVSDAGFTAKLPSNMERIADILLTAHKLEPYRIDFVLGAANAYIYNGNVDKAIDLYQQALEIAPDDVKTNMYLASWYRYKNDEANSQKYLQHLEKIAPEKAAILKQTFATIDKIAKAPIVDKSNTKLTNHDAIITLGYALNPDGSMHDILIQRLQKTLELAKQNPEALIIVTGGVPKNNQTEGNLMKKWLIEQGIDANRIFADNYARSTVENALYSRYTLAHHKIKHAILISSGSHVRRGQTLFELATRESGPQGITFESVAALDKPIEELQKITPKDLLGIYRDSLITIGLPMFNSGVLRD
ncbi:ElyC/SanA/YdcF family protein [Gallibacterium melopsittaci]|uniref:ElyC/SanA/YdcF family protein n=1 Tax=Gallibacterium melopsittaci TaxID=516063 RepID=A0ABV6HYG6_9PAST